MDLPLSNCSYKDVNYWNERYKTEENYEWFKSYKDFMHLLKQFLKVDHKIIMLGCGNSSLSEHMYQDGFREIVNVDFSSVVNKKMFNRAPLMDWLTMDIQHLAFQDKTFDVVLEKGTLDALLVEEDVWNVSEKAKSMISQVMNNVYRVLKDDGVFISVTFAQPHFRVPLLNSSKWRIKQYTFGDGFHYFFYVACKNNDEKVAELKRVNNIHRENEIHARTSLRIPIKPISCLVELNPAPVHKEKKTEPRTLSIGSGSDPQEFLAAMDRDLAKIRATVPDGQSVVPNDICFNALEEPNKNVSCNGSDWGLKWQQILICSLILSFCLPIFIWMTHLQVNTNGNNDIVNVSRNEP